MGIRAKRPRVTKEFTVKLRAGGPTGTQAVMSIPFDASKVFGPRPIIPVRGTVNGFEFRKSLMPIGGGKFVMMLHRVLKRGARVEVGDRVKVVMERDTAPRIVSVPGDFQTALDKRAKAAGYFRTMSYPHKKRYVDWIGEAKGDERRKGRIKKAILMMEEDPRKADF
ncbi:MAG: YdeI/OmpD-associated family protein [Planctomycetota bacterium]|nr:YdeI/OmpD-associated family protein [Planctomycetota bacterium]